MVKARALSESSEYLAAQLTNQTARRRFFPGTCIKYKLDTHLLGLCRSTFASSLSRRSCSCSPLTCVLSALRRACSSSSCCLCLGRSSSLAMHILFSPLTSRYRWQRMSHLGLDRGISSDSKPWTTRLSLPARLLISCCTMFLSFLKAVKDFYNVSSRAYRSRSLVQRSAILCLKFEYIADHTRNFCHTPAALHHIPEVFGKRATTVHYRPLFQNVEVGPGWENDRGQQARLFTCTSDHCPISVRCSGESQRFRLQ